MASHRRRSGRPPPDALALPPCAFGPLLFRLVVGVHEERLREPPPWSQVLRRPRYQPNPLPCEQFAPRLPGLPWRPVSTPSSPRQPSRRRQTLGSGDRRAIGFLKTCRRPLARRGLQCSRDPPLLASQRYGQCWSSFHRALPSKPVPF